MATLCTDLLINLHASFALQLLAWLQNTRSFCSSPPPPNKNEQNQKKQNNKQDMLNKKDLCLSLCRALDTFFLFARARRAPRDPSLDALGDQGVRILLRRLRSAQAERQHAAAVCRQACGESFWPLFKEWMAQTKVTKLFL